MPAKTKGRNPAAILVTGYIMRHMPSGGAFATKPWPKILRPERRLLGLGGRTRPPLPRHRPLPAPAAQAVTGPRPRPTPRRKSLQSRSLSLAGGAPPATCRGPGARRFLQAWAPRPPSLGGSGAQRPKHPSHLRWVPAPHTSRPGAETPPPPAGTWVGVSTFPSSSTSVPVYLTCSGCCGRSSTSCRLKGPDHLLRSTGIAEPRRGRQRRRVAGGKAQACSCDSQHSASGREEARDQRP